jgi:Uma2 family endonuclease
MNILHRALTAEREPRQRLVLYGITWKGCERILEVMAAVRVRMNYYRGTLELKTVYPPHEMFKTLLGRILDVVAEELGVRIKAVGSSTMRRQDVESGLEPDGGYYLASSPRVRNWREIDLEVDPPPDLCVEVEISRGLGDRLAIYAALGVPELWRCDGQTLEAWRLRDDGKYERCPQSPSMPFLPLDEVFARAVQCLDKADDGAWQRSVRTWVRDRVKPLWEAAGRPGSRP